MALPFSFTGTFHCFGWVTMPNILVLTMWLINDENRLRLLTPLSWWNWSAHMASSAVISFSPTRFLRCIMHGMACIISMITASLPSSPLEMAWAIIWSCCSILRNWLSMLHHSSMNPYCCSFLRCSSLVRRLVKKLRASNLSSSVNPDGIKSMLYILDSRVTLQGS